MAGRMSRTGPALKSKGGPGPCTTPGPITGITLSSHFHPLPLTGWAAWHCALADWRAQTGCCEAVHKPIKTKLCAKNKHHSSNILSERVSL